jgi:hypothetical protein
MLAWAPDSLAEDRILDFDIHNPFKGQNDLHVAWMGEEDA